ncbi:hypothetical protein VQ042_23365, partial [Aurantimonas sp. A2-1-M11]|uniref:hypothetical protein n=1 Tax=Aurantimonas sp. A2-1-M11 TaxID=3113712 RepID=UPI002F9476DC
TGNQSGQDRFPAFSNTSNPMGIPEAQGIQGFFRANPLGCPGRSPDASGEGIAPGDPGTLREGEGDCHN